jgi:hypothetical protein
LLTANSATLAYSVARRYEKPTQSEGSHLRKQYMRCFRSTKLEAQVQLLYYTEQGLGYQDSSGAEREVRYNIEMRAD